MYKEKICLICGAAFIPKSGKQAYCNREIEVSCIVCGKKFKTKCNKERRYTCSKKCAGKHNASQCVNVTKKCEICGQEFHPKSSRQKFCHKTIVKTCEICGKEFETTCGTQDRHTCRNKECEAKYAHLKSVEAYKNETRVCEWCGKEFTPKNNTQKYCERTHYQTCLNCGEKFEVNLKKQEEIPQFCSHACYARYYSGDRNVLKRPEVQAKIRETNLKRYGVEHPAQAEQVRQKMYATYKGNTGYDHPLHNPEVRSRQAKHSQASKFEARVAALLDNYDIDYIRQYTITNDIASHAFDFYLPKFKVLIDCDGVFYHSYLSDPNGKQVMDYYDEDRLALIPKDHIFHVIVEGKEEHDIKELERLLRDLDKDVFAYNSHLFKWCRSIDFPFSEYTDGRMRKDWDSLCNYYSNSYRPSCRLGDSIIENFHHSMYHARVGNYKSPYDGWYDDSTLKKVIANRLIYKNDVNPHKVLRGFNISKLCPRVSKFNPVLAKYLCVKYLSEYSSVFDPFSGFSGRLLGVVASGKTYYGQDLNEDAVRESNQIIEFLGIEDKATVVNKNVLDSQRKVECLLTCPPYGTKEIYNKETVFKTCDQWIDECLNRFDANKYVFVVDKTEKYEDKIVEEIKNVSHLNKSKELVLMF